MKRRVSGPLMVLAVASIATAAHAGVTPVTICGQTFTGGQAVLQQDLDCTGFANGVLLERTPSPRTRFSRSS